MKERFEIYDGSAELKSKEIQNLSGFIPLFTASARRSIARGFLKGSGCCWGSLWAW